MLFNLLRQLIVKSFTLLLVVLNSHFSVTGVEKLVKQMNQLNDFLGNYLLIQYVLYKIIFRLKREKEYKPWSVVSKSYLFIALLVQKEAKNERKDTCENEA